MTKFLALTKMFIKQNFRLFKTNLGGKKKSGKKGAAIALWILLGYSFLVIGGMIAVSTFMLGMGCDKQYADKVLTLLILACQGMVLIFGLHSVINGIFVTKDNERVLYLPANKLTLFLARFAAVYFSELLFSLIGAVIALIPFAIGASLGVAFYVTLPFLCLLMPLLPLVLCCILAIPLSYLSRLLSRHAVLKVIFQILMVVVFMGLYLWFMLSLMQGTTELEESQDLTKILSDLIKNLPQAVLYIYPVSFFASAMASAGIGDYLLNLGGAIGCSVVLLAITILLAVPTYTKNLSRSLETGGGSAKREKIKIEIKSRSIIESLIKTDLKRTIRDPQLGMQMFMGMIVTPLILAVFSFSFNSITLDGGTNLFDTPLYQAIAPVVIMMYLLLILCSSNMIGIYPFSRERQGFYILKTLPVPIEKILMAKVLLATLFMLATNLLSVVFIVIFMHVEWYWALILMIALTFYQFGSMCITTYADLKSPVLDWTNFNTSFKTAKNSFVGMLIGLIAGGSITGVSIAFILLYVAAPNIIYPIVMWVLVTIVGALFAWLAFRFLRQRGQAAFEDIE